MMLFVFNMGSIQGFMVFERDGLVDQLGTGVKTAFNAIYYYRRIIR